MSYSGHFDSTAAEPSPILGWYDTGSTSYPNLPREADLFEMTPSQWNARTSGRWAVQGGQLVAYTPPAPVATAAQLAQAAMLPSSPGAGIVVTCPGNAALNGTYAIDTAAQMKMIAVAAALNAGLGLPGGGATMLYPDIGGTMRPWPAALFLKLAQAAMNLVYALDLVIAGHTADLPGQAVTLS